MKRTGKAQIRLKKLGKVTYLSYSRGYNYYRTHGDSSNLRYLILDLGDT